MFAGDTPMWEKKKAALKWADWQFSSKLIEDMPPDALVAPFHFGGNLSRTTFMITPSI